MKVISGDFGETEKGPTTGEKLMEHITMAGLADRKTGSYVLLFDEGDATFVMSNASGPGEVLLELEKGRMAIMAEELTRSGE